MNAKLCLTAAALGLPLLITTGCGMVAAPQAPSLKLPNPVTDLTAQRTGNQVALHWTMPKRTTDNVILVGNQKAKVCRWADTGPCIPVGITAFAPQAAASYTDSLPSDLSSGALRPLRYTVELESPAGRTAGPSNIAITAAGSAPPQITALQAHARADGILLTWTPSSGSETVRIDRKLVQKPTQKPGTAKSELPLEQTLEFSGKDQGKVLDRDAALDNTYAYSAQRIAKTDVQGKPIEVPGPPSETITIDARDLFPPATPQGLQAVADPEAAAIDLSWQPGTEADLAGYTVYRREAGPSAPPVRISPPAQTAPSYRDATAAPGRTYAYSVTAVDRDHNESPRSAEVEESLPNK